MFAVLISTPLRADDAGLRAETFDADPQWDGFRNRLLPESLPVVRQDFGYRRTNFAGGRRAGEIGGTVQRTATPARYSMPIAEKTFDHKLSASGTFAVTEAGSGSGVMFGWFNKNSLGWRTPNSLAFRLDGNGGKYWMFCEYGTRHRRTGGVGVFEGERYQTTPTPPFAADGTPHRWSLDYDPAATDGPGFVTLRIDDRIDRVPVPSGHKADGASFDRFGIWNVETGGDGLNVFFDDLTVDGEPFSFDRDPQWIGEGNDVQFEERVIRPHHDYGFSPTNFTGGDPGEIGGVLFRDEQPSYYAANVGELTFAQPLHASGKIVLRSAGADSGIVLGWFDSASKRNKATPEHEQRQPNYLGVMIEGPSRVGHYFRAAYADSSGGAAAPAQDVHTGKERPVILPGPTVHRWAIDYDPAAGEGNGRIRNGRITVTFDGLTHRLDLRPQDRAAGATFDRFGLFNIQSGGHHVEAYLDGLSFTADDPAP